MTHGNTATMTSMAGQTVRPRRRAAMKPVSTSADTKVAAYQKRVSSRETNLTRSASSRSPVTTRR
jgi:hypothetical protein